MLWGGGEDIVVIGADLNQRAPHAEVERSKPISYPSRTGRHADGDQTVRPKRPEPAGVLKLEPICGATAFAPMLRCSSRLNFHLADLAAAVTLPVITPPWARTHEGVFLGRSY
jgi:hypothetical protein